MLGARDGAPAFAHIADGKAVDQSGQRAFGDPHAVLGLARVARSVGDGHLDDGVPQVPSGRGDEPVHAPELERELQRDLAFHDPQRAPGVADRVAKEPQAELATDPGPDLADLRVALRTRCGAISLHEVGVALFEQREHLREVRRVVLEVGVEDADECAARGAEPGVERRGLPVARPLRRVGHRDAAEPAVILGVGEHTGTGRVR